MLDRRARPLSAVRLLIPLCLGLGLGACGSDDSPVIPPFTLTFSVAAGDLNGDGRPDLTSANIFIAGPPPHPGHVSVILQSQSSPGAFGGARNLDVGSDTVMVSIGDLNGDNLMDVVATNESSASLSILFQDSTLSECECPGNLFPSNRSRGKVFLCRHRRLQRGWSSRPRRDQS